MNKYLMQCSVSLLMILLNASLSRANTAIEYSIGFTNSRGLLGVGYLSEKNLFNLGISKEFYAGTTGFFAGPNFTFERRLLDNSTPYFSIQYIPIFASKSFSWNGRSWNDGLNSGLVALSLGYQYLFKKIGIQGEVSVDTPVTTKLGNDLRFQWGLGLSYISK